MRHVDVQIEIEPGAEISAPAPVRVSFTIAASATLVTAFAVLLPRFDAGLLLGAGVLLIALWLGVAFDAYARRSSRALPVSRKLKLVRSRTSQEPPRPSQPHRHAA